MKQPHMAYNRLIIHLDSTSFKCYNDHPYVIPAKQRGILVVSVCKLTSYLVYRFVVIAACFSNNGHFAFIFGSVYIVDFLAVLIKLFR